MPGNTWPFKLLFKAEHLPLDHTAIGSCSLGFWGKVCDRRALIRNQMKQGKSVEVLRMSFADCHAPLITESLLVPKVWADKSHRSQEGFLWSLASGCLQLAVLKLNELQFGSL